MLGLDDRIAHLGAGGGLAAALAIALLLGLRHATDPDHLTAVSTLVMSEDRHAPRRAGRLGLAWGAGHAFTLVLLGLPVVALGSHIPDGLRAVFETTVGIVIVALGARLLLRWRRGYFHVHVHDHDGTPHAHVHMHERPAAGAHPRNHAHSHAHDLGRTPLASFAIGLVHGAGGSAGVGVLLIAALPTAGERSAGLVVLALGAALSMGAITAAFGHALARGPIVRRIRTAAPALGVVSVAFGVWYTLGALLLVPYLF